MPVFDIRDVNTVPPEGLNVVRIKQMNEDVFTCKHIYVLLTSKKNCKQQEYEAKHNLYSVQSQSSI